MDPFFCVSATLEEHCDGTPKVVYRAQRDFEGGVLSFGEAEAVGWVEFRPE